MPAYTVREWDKLAYGEGDGQIPARHADRLAGLAARSAFAGRGGSGVLEHGRHALRARGVTGEMLLQALVPQANIVQLWGKVRQRLAINRHRHTARLPAHDGKQTAAVAGA